MNCLLVRSSYMQAHSGAPTMFSLLALLICFSLTVPAQNTSPSGNASQPLSIRATHLLGFENVKSNRNGILSIQNDALQFQQGNKPATGVKIATVRDIFLGGENKQIGGLPMTLGKTAAPFGGGRVVSLFAHKKYDNIALEYVDNDGGLHGAIFEVSNGQGEVLRDALLARGALPSSGRDRSTKQSAAEVTHEDK